MSIVSLSLIMPPPSSPAETLGAWVDVEDALGTALPNDFKEFIHTYGSGTIGRFLSVLNPFSKRPALNLREQSQRQLDTLRALHDDFGELCPYDLYPICGGLLPVAITDNGDVIHWLTRGEPDGWGIVVNEARSPDYQQFDDGLTAFLEAILDGSVHCRAFPKAIFGADGQFRSA